MKTETLTKLEEKILRMQADGNKLDTICHSLGQSKHVVEYRLYLARKKLGLKTIVDVVRWSLKLLLLVTLPVMAQLPPIPQSVVAPPQSIGACASLAWDYPTNALGGSNGIAGFTVGWGVAPLYAALSNTVSWGISTLTPLPNTNVVVIWGLFTNQPPTTNGMVTFTNQVCGFTNAGTWYFRALAYDAYGNQSDWSDYVAWTNAAALTNVVITIRAQYATNILGPWITPPAYTNVVQLTNPVGQAIYRWDIQKRYQ